MLAACKEETAAYRRQVSALEKRVQEAEATAAGKEQECAELNEALEELEQEKRSEMSELESMRECERRHLQQQHREKLGQVEHRYQREQHALRSFVFATAKGMLKDVNMDRALSAADLYSDSDSE